MGSELETEAIEDCCRTCLSHRKPVTSIQELSQTSSVLKPLLTYLQITVMNEKYPNQICNECIGQIEQFQKFREECSKSFKFLTDKLNKISRKCVSPIKDDDLNPQGTIQGTQEIKLETEIIKEEINVLEETNDFGFEDGNLTDYDSPNESEPSKKNDKAKKKYCKICKKDFSDLRRHNLYLHTDPSQRPIFKCVECNLVFNHRKSLYIHKRRIHDKTLIKVTCEICGSCVYNLAKHMDITHGNVKYNCKYCDKSFKAKYSLKIHTDFVHENQIPSVLCQLCGKPFRSNSDLNKHMQVRHSDARNYKCTFCEKKFKTSSQSREHERTVHATVKPFVCTFCPNAYALKKTLVNHIVKTHSDRRDFKCEVCSKAFKSKDNLNNHTRIHTGEKPFVCEICDKAFTHLATLFRHRKTHDHIK